MWNSYLCFPEKIGLNAWQRRTDCVVRHRLLYRQELAVRCCLCLEMTFILSLAWAFLSVSLVQCDAVLKLLFDDVFCCVVIVNKVIILYWWRLKQIMSTMSKK